MPDGYDREQAGAPQSVTQHHDVPHQPISVFEPVPPEIAKAIVLVQQRMAKGVEKDAANEQERYRYVSIAGLMLKLAPLMAEAGLFLTWRVVAERIEEHLLTITYDFALGHVSGAVSPVLGRHTGAVRWRFKSGSKDDRAWNKALTTARKYALISIFSIPTDQEDDPDGDAADERKAGAVKAGGATRPANETQATADLRAAINDLRKAYRNAATIDDAEVEVLSEFALDVRRRMSPAQAEFLASDFKAVWKVDIPPVPAHDTVGAA